MSVVNSVVDITGNKIIARPRSLIQPAEPLVLAGSAAAQRNFVTQDGGYAIDMVIDNIDTVNTLKFFLNNNVNQIITLAANSVFNAGDVRVVQINVLAGSTNWQLIYNIVRRPEFQ